MIDFLKLHLFDLFIVLLAISICVLSFLIDKFGLSHSKEITWFGRSGSIMVIIGIFLEWWQNKNTETVYVRDLSQTLLHVSKEDMTTPRKIFHYIAIGLAVLGTLIWGYGDICFET